MIIDRREFLRQTGFGALQLGFIGYLSGASWADPSKTNQLPRILPELEGVSSEGILDFINAVKEKNLNLHSIMMVRRGKVVAEGWWAPYTPDLKHTLYSLSKSFTSTAIGLAVGEGRLTVNDKVLSFFPNDAPPEVSENLAKMRVRDLLTMSTGHNMDSTPAVRAGNNQNWVKAFLAQPVEHEPGTFFVYNSGATYMLSAIIQKLTGQTLLDYLTPRLFKPLGIEGADWEVDPNGINTGGWGLRVKTEDIAKFGYLYLQKGVWNGKRILSEAWINEATKSHIQSKGGGRKPQEQNDWQQGYGYQFWRCRHGAYRGDGAYGQYCIVVPEKEMVIAITSESGDMGSILDQVWTHLLPAATEEKAIKADKSEQALLKGELLSLELPSMVGMNNKEESAAANGKAYKIDNNALKIDRVSLLFGNDTCTFTYSDDSGQHAVQCGLGKWLAGETNISTVPLKLVMTPVPGEKVSKIAACGNWVGSKTFKMIWRFIETAHYETVTCNFEGDELTVAFRRSLAILANGKDPRPVLSGKLIA